MYDGKIFRVVIICVGIAILGSVKGSFAAQIQSDHERAEQTSRYVPVPNFPNGPIEFVRDGVDNGELMVHYLKPSTIRFIKSQHLTWLQVRDAYIDKQGITKTSAGYLVPVILGVRYQKKWTIIDGTLNALFHITTQRNHVRVQLIDIDDNAIWQGFGRLFWKVDYKRFIDDVAGETLRSYFRQPESVPDFLSVIPR